MATTAAGRTMERRRTRSLQAKRHTTSCNCECDHVPVSGHNIDFVDASLLSRIELPTFSGSILDFQEFYERFSALVGNKSGINDATKLCLLKSCLKGRALSCIQGLPITSTNYMIAIDILKSHYDDKVTARHLLLTKLANLPACDQEGRNLMSLYNNMYALTRQLCSYGNDNNEIGIGAILLNKLPRYVRSTIYDKTSNKNNLTPSELIRLLTDIVRKESTLQEMECESRYGQFDQSYQFYVNSKPSTTFRPTTNDNTTKQSRCKFCSDIGHTSFTCRMYPTPSSRISIVKEKQLCYNCLSDRHPTTRCTSKKTCSTCSKPHHTSLCYRKQTNTYSSQSQILQETAERNYRGQLESSTRQKAANTHFSKEVEVSTPPSENLKHTATLHANKQLHESGKPMLMCVDITLFNPEKSDIEIHTTALLDTGASQSYITNDLAHQLKLQLSDQQEINMYTFASNAPISLPATTHTIGIRCADNTEAYLQAQAIPRLTRKLKYAYLEDSQLHLISTKESTLQILIGMDYFWSLVYNEQFHVSTVSSGSRRYRVINTRIGKIVTNSSFHGNQSNNITSYEPTSVANPGDHSELPDRIQLSLQEQVPSNNHSRQELLAPCIEEIPLEAPTSFAPPPPEFASPPAVQDPLHQGLAPSPPTMPLIPSFLQANTPSSNFSPFHPPHEHTPAQPPQQLVPPQQHVPQEQKPPAFGFAPPPQQDFEDKESSSYVPTEFLQTQNTSSPSTPTPYIITSPTLISAPCPILESSLQLFQSMQFSTPNPAAPPTPYYPSSTQPSYVSRLSYPTQQQQMPPQEQMPHPHRSQQQYPQNFKNSTHKSHMSLPFQKTDSKFTPMKGTIDDELNNIARPGIYLNDNTQQFIISSFVYFSLYKSHNERGVFHSYFYRSLLQQ